MEGKRILAAEVYLKKLQAVLQTRNDLFVVARTDASDELEIHRRVTMFSETDADGVLVDGIGSLSLLRDITSATDKPVAFNQISGGMSANHSLADLEEAGVSLAIFSTPCLFAAQRAITGVMSDLRVQNRINDGDSDVSLSMCNDVLNSNLRRRDSIE